MLGQKLAELRKKKGLSQYEMAERLGVSRGKLANYEQGSRQPDFFDVSTDYLLGRVETSKADNNLPELTAKEERDIAKDLENMLNALDSKDGYAAFDGRDMQDMDEEDRELLKASLENSLRLAKRMAMQKFTPKKYR
ncbi:helix-turn-helix domain-containing protein [Sporosarcina sp. FSL W7-1283]|uniref:helix-turn-helix domain-containing protein n=1 Tax=Sporosarcina sp. FSL W7-1283 TaxID=2921560 RepID=UPI0030F9C69A